MKILLTLALAVFCASISYTQTIGEFKPKDDAFGLNKVKTKKVYIASFTVNYQIYNSKDEFKQGGRMLGGGRSGDSKASLSVGLENLTEQGLQAVTDKLFQDFISQLKGAGLEIISADEAGKAPTYEGFTKMTGGKMNEAQFPGTLASTPSGFDYYVKAVEKSGKEKSGGFMNQASFVHTKLSKDLDDAIISDVDLFVLFLQDRESLDLAGANIKVKTNMRLAGPEAIEMASTAKFKLKGQNTYTGVNSQVAFYSGKIGAGAVSSYVGSLKKSMEIDGVIEDKKIQAFARTDRDHVGVSTLYATWYNPGNITSKNTTIIPVDQTKYTEGAYIAGKKFIDFHAGEFLSKIK